VNSQTHAPSAAHPGYRTDIDGLRAIAVLFVIGFHTFPALFPGGFVGVEVFFVISGGHELLLALEFWHSRLLVLF
jgi:peptidoglycan/LPS O-acetylase OafA/YrhL